MERPSLAHHGARRPCRRRSARCAPPSNTIPAAAQRRIRHPGAATTTAPGDNAQPVPVSSTHLERVDVAVESRHRMLEVGNPCPGNLERDVEETLGDRCARQPQARTFHQAMSPRVVSGHCAPVTASTGPGRPLRPDEAGSSRFPQPRRVPRPSGPRPGPRRGGAPERHGAPGELGEHRADIDAGRPVADSELSVEQ